MFSSIGGSNPFLSAIIVVCMPKAEHDYLTLEGIRAKSLLSTNGCWEWQGWKGRDGYGRFRRRPFEYLVHRVSWCLTNGVEPNALKSSDVIMHTCDNPPCCNPDHLRLGTHSQNHADMVAKGRHSYPPKQMMVGATNPNASLTDRQAKEVYALTQAGTLTLKQIGARYGITLSMVSRIKLKKSWSHIHK